MSSLLTPWLVVACIAITPVHSVISICQYINCPRYAATIQNQNYEERVYAQENWVSTTGDPNRMEESRLLMFQRLLAYFGGQNVQGRHMNITLPFLTKVVRSSSSNVTTGISMFMYIPYSSQTSPPAPTDPMVHVQTTPVKHIYSRSFGGWTTRDGVNKIRSDLRQFIGNTLLLEDDHFYIATYSGALQWQNRYNELWIARKDLTNIMAASIMCPTSTEDNKYKWVTIAMFARPMFQHCKKFNSMNL